MAHEEPSNSHSSKHSLSGSSEDDAHEIYMHNKPIIEDENIIDEQSIELEEDKKAIYSHPLFPLLALLFEKCEMATLNIAHADGGSLNKDVEEFILHQKREGRPFLTNDPEIDSLMIKAIQVLRIHLLEMEKVSDLCNDFCHRYIGCLRTKLSSENLLRGCAVFGSTSLSGSSSSHLFDGSSCSSNSDDQMIPDERSSSPGTSSNASHVSAAMGAAHHSMSSGPQRTVAPQIPKQKVPSNEPYKVHPSFQRLENESDCSSEEFQDAGQSGKKQSGSKRAILPKQATAVMRSWLFQHIVHPYPTEDEKKAIANQTNLTLLQVNNWFINARRRILQPMLDTANALNSAKGDPGANMFSHGSMVDPSSSDHSPTKSGHIAKKMKSVNSLNYWSPVVGNESHNQH